MTGLLFTNLVIHKTIAIVAVPNHSSSHYHSTRIPSRSVLPHLSAIPSPYSLYLLILRGTSSYSICCTLSLSLSLLFPPFSIYLSIFLYFHYLSLSLMSLLRCQLSLSHFLPPTIHSPSLQSPPSYFLSLYLLTLCISIPYLSLPSPLPSHLPTSPLSLPIIPIFHYYPPSLD